MSAFMEEYEKQHSELVCIPGFEMNRPYAGSVVSGDVGLELEIEGVSLPSQGALERISGKRSGTRWETKTDGSLRGEALEYVLSGPCFIDEVEPLITGLYDKFKDTGTRLALTNRCSTHVHVNMTGKKVNEITSAIALWSAFEEPLTLWAGEERVNNHFCLTGKDSNQGTIHAWRGFLRTGGTRFRDNLKYSALNILTLQRFGSLEYRVMNASEDPSRLIDWTKFVFTLTRYAGEQFNNPRSLLYAMSERGGREMFRDICERAGVSADFVLGVEATVPEMNQAVLDGFRRAQPLVAGFDWDAWMPEINKEYVVDPFGRKKKIKKSVYDTDAVDLGFDIDLADRAPRIVFDPGRMAPAPTAPVEPVRPAFVPRNYIWADGVWQNPDWEQIRGELQRSREIPVGPNYFRNYRGIEEETFSINFARPIEFVDGTEAIIVQISNRGDSFQAAPLVNMVWEGIPLRQGYWYRTSDGGWSGGTRSHPAIRNVR